LCTFFILRNKKKWFWMCYVNQANTKNNFNNNNKEKQGRGKQGGGEYEISERRERGAFKSTSFLSHFSLYKTKTPHKEAPAL